MRNPFTPMGIRCGTLLIILTLGFSLSHAAELAPGPGRLLVADESMRDGKFKQTVVLLLRHDPRGSVGLILNRPTEISVKHALSDAGAFSGRSETVSYGGPVDLRAMLVLLRSHTPPTPSQRVGDGLYVTSTSGVADRLHAGLETGERFRVFMGHAGWAPGQLEKEIGRGGWTVYPADGEIPFGDHPETLWFKIQDGRHRDWI